MLVSFHTKYETAVKHEYRADHKMCFLHIVNNWALPWSLETCDDSIRLYE